MGSTIVGPCAEPVGSSCCRRLLQGGTSLRLYCSGSVDLALLQVVGELGLLLAAASGKADGEPSAKVVAGARNPLNLEFSWAAA